MYLNQPGVFSQGSQAIPRDNVAFATWALVDETHRSSTLKVFLKQGQGWPCNYLELYSTEAENFWFWYTGHSPQIPLPPTWSIKIKDKTE